MELSTMRSVVKLAETANYSRAAEQLFITQPALSQQIHSLEEELGLKLFERTTRRVSLTRPGEEFVRRARQILREVERLSQSMDICRREMLGSLSIGLLGTLSHLNIPQYINSFQTVYPNIQIRFQIGWSATLIEQVLHQELDAAITNIHCEGGEDRPPAEGAGLFGGRNHRFMQPPKPGCRPGICYGTGPGGPAGGGQRKIHQHPDVDGCHLCRRRHGVPGYCLHLPGYGKPHWDGAGQHRPLPPFLRGGAAIYHRWGAGLCAAPSGELHPHRDDHPGRTAGGFRLAAAVRGLFLRHRPWTDGVGRWLGGGRAGQIFRLPGGEGDREAGRRACTGRKKTGSSASFSPQGLDTSASFSV